MEKTNKLVPEKKTSSAKQISSSDSPKQHVIWDCGSSLYDSFELKSFEKQLESAIVSRTLSMPHLSDHHHRRRLTPPPPLPPPLSNKISRSIQRLVRAVFRPKSSTNSCINYNKVNTAAVSPAGKLLKRSNKLEEFYVVNYDHKPSTTAAAAASVLSTIPEVSEHDDDDDHIHGMSSLVRRTASDRFSVATKTIGDFLS